MPHRIPPTLSATPRPLGRVLSALHLASQLTEARRCLIALNGEAGFLAESDVYRAVLRNMSAATGRSVLQCVHAMLTTAAEDLPPHELGIFTLWVCGAAAELLDPSAEGSKSPNCPKRADTDQPPTPQERAREKRDTQVRLASPPRHASEPTEKSPPGPPSEPDIESPPEWISEPTVRSHPAIPSEPHLASPP